MHESMQNGFYVAICHGLTPGESCRKKTNLLLEHIQQGNGGKIDKMINEGLLLYRYIYIDWASHTVIASAESSGFEKII